MQKLTISSSMLALTLMFSTQTSNSQTKPATPPSSVTVDTEPSIGPMRIRKLGGYNYLYITRNTSLRQIGQVVNPEMAKLMDMLKAGNIQPVGPVVLTYHNFTGNPQQKFDLDIGIQVAEGATAPSGYLLKHVPPTLCGTILYGGAMTTISKAYAELYGNLASRDLIPTGENREYFMSWDGEESPNNILMLAVCGG